MSLAKSESFGRNVGVLYMPIQLLQAFVQTKSITTRKMEIWRKKASLPYFFCHEECLSRVSSIDDLARESFLQFLIKIIILCGIPKCLSLSCYTVKHLPFPLFSNLIRYPLCQFSGIHPHSLFCLEVSSTNFKAFRSVLSIPPAFSFLRCQITSATSASLIVLLLDQALDLVVMVLQFSKLVFKLPPHCLVCDCL